MIEGFRKMNYFNTYSQIIKKAKKRNLPIKKLKGFERHHIIPRSCGGTNEKKNQVDLTPREHFICHWLLTKIYVDQKKKRSMHNAFWMMANRNSNRLNSISYEKLKVQYNKLTDDVFKNKLKSENYTQNDKGFWVRICPHCTIEVEHKTRAKCQLANRLQKICSKCAAKARGEKTAKKDVCPVCNETCRIDKLDSHALDQHSMTLEELWLIKHNEQVPSCKCKCGELTKFVSWNAGYNTYIDGHSGRIYSSHDAEKAKDISDRRRQKLIGQPGWALGLTKESDQRVKERGEKTAIGLKRAFDNGLTPWSKGLTKETDPRVRMCSEILKETYASGRAIPWMKGKTKETDPRIQMMATKISTTHKQKEIRDRLDSLKRLSKEEIITRINSNDKFLLLDDLSSYKNKNANNIKARCKNCQNDFITSIDRLIGGRCELCNPHVSSGHLEICKFLDSLSVEYRTNDRTQIKPLELDIFVPSKSLAIEYNGLYWHSEINKSAIYHDNKTKQCHDANLKLFHIFDDEWKEKKEIVQSMIKHRLGIFDRSIGARKCQLVTLDNKQRIEFFENNHVDDDTSAGYTLALIHNDEVVAALSIRKAFHKKYVEYLEVARFCTKTNTNVPGALSRLTKHAVQYAKHMGYKKLITYVDTRLGFGLAYEKAGFQLINKTAPRFWWTDMTYRFNRFKFRADSKAGLTEAQVAADAGVVKIWGCKNLVFELSCV